MKRTLSLLALLCVCLGWGQRTLSGTLSPAEQFNWLLLYRIAPSEQVYLIDTEVKDGKFSFEMPEASVPGTYRVVYAVPQDEFYFDVIYTGKEDVEIDFSFEEGLQIIQSEENKNLYGYLGAVLNLESKVNEKLEVGATTLDPEVQSFFDSMAGLQAEFEADTQGEYAHDFVNFNKPFLPKAKLTDSEYQAAKQAHILHQLDFSNTKLQASTFLTDKALAYSLMATPLTGMSRNEAELAIQKNLLDIEAKLPETIDIGFKARLFYDIWKQMDKIPLNSVSDFIYNTYLEPLPDKTSFNNIKKAISEKMRLRIGAQAPELYWRSGDESFRLGDLTGAERYVLAFWSSSCSHCLIEMPKLQEKIAGYPNTIFLAVGLEDPENQWAEEIEKLPGFTHAMAPGKWESEAAKDYAIQGTPSFIVLDAKKRIEAKPEDLEGLFQVLNGR